MATITAGASFQLRMDVYGNIPELKSFWGIFPLSASSVGTFTRDLLRSGPYFTTYTVTGFGEISYDGGDSEIIGIVEGFELRASSSNARGQNGTLLTVHGAEVPVEGMSRISLGQFLFDDDTIRGSILPDVIRGLSGNDSIDGRSGFDLIYGGPGNDTLNGGRGNDTLSGDSGNDVLNGGTSSPGFPEGADTLNGGSGFDRVQFGGANVIVNLARGYMRDGGGLNDILISIEGVTGSSFRDVMIGSNQSERFIGNAGADRISAAGGNDRIDGGRGNDVISGGTGRDTLNGGAGNDRLSGGTGPDIFVFDQELVKANRDVITSFVSGRDKIYLDTAVFQLGEAGVSIGSNPNIDATLVYNQANGVLYYDSDGPGESAPVAFAVLSNKPVLLLSDVVLF